jgi:signal peptidase I
LQISPEQFAELQRLPIFRGTIVSGSMEPIIKTGERVMVDVGNQDLKRFDIIVFYQKDKLICHYLWSINQRLKPKLLQTRSMYGHKDFPIKEEQYLGKVISHKINLWRKLLILMQNLL